VQVLILIGMTVVEAVMGSPPKRTALDRRIARNRGQKLRPARGFESPVREITMIEAGDREHP
jgi:hypothetical protein